MPLTFIEFPACEQIFLVISHGDTSALQGKHLSVEERGAAAGRRAALFLRRPPDRDCVICGVIKTGPRGDVILEIARWPPDSSVPLLIPPLLHKMETAHLAGVAMVARQLNATFLRPDKCLFQAPRVQSPKNRVCVRGGGGGQGGSQEPKGQDVCLQSLLRCFFILAAA